MTTFENFLSEATSKMENSIGGWTTASPATLSRKQQFSIYTVTLDSEVMANSMKIVATGDDDIEVVTEQFDVTVEETHKSFAWVVGSTLSAVHCGIRYYDVGGSVLQDTSTEFAPISTIGWNGVFHTAKAPAAADVAEMYLTFDTILTGEIMYVTRPSVMQQTKITTDFVDYALYNVPNYMIEADAAQKGTGGSRVATPLARYVTVATHQLSGAQDTITAWDFVHPTYTEDGEPDNSTLADPYQADDAWLPWLAQTMGVTLGTIAPGSGRSPWLAFTQAGIDTWTEWEEDVDPGSVPGVPDTEWVDIETFNPGYFDAGSGYRDQIASGYNGILGGTSESFVAYISTLLNTTETSPFVYVVKHWATNPYRLLVAVLETEDPDPTGNLLDLIVSGAAPAGTSASVDHGVSVTAKTFWDPARMFYNMAEVAVAGGGTLPTRFVEGGAANGRHITLASVTGATEPFMGGGMALARWFPGYAFYPGAVEVSTGTVPDCNITGDIDIRVLLSDITEPASTVEIAASPNKWTLEINSTGNLVFSWEDSGTNSAVSTVPVNWGSRDSKPFWIRITLDVDNGASGNDVSFYRSPTLYEDAWTQIGDTVTAAGTTAIDSATATVTMLGNDTDPVDSMSGIAYRIQVLDGIDGTVALDIDVTGEIDRSASLISTGTQFFRLSDTNQTDVNIVPAASGATYLVESEWTAQVQLGEGEYFYLGRSPYKYDSGNGTGLGDTLVVSGLSSDTYDWEITKIDTTTISGSTGTVTSITFDSDDYGGTAIADITVRESTGQTIQAKFEPVLLSGDTTTDTDAYGSDWTLTRDWTKTAFYEYSSYVDRDHISPTDGSGAFDSGIVFDADEAFTVAVAVRRFWSGSGVTNIINQTTTSGWLIQYNGDNIEAKVTDGTTTVTLSYDEVVGGTLGEFTLIALRRNIASGTMSLWINGVSVDSDDDPFIGAGLFATTGSTGYVGDDSATDKFDFRYIGIFNRSLSDDVITYLAEEMERNVLALPQAPSTIVTASFPSGYLVHNPTVTQT